MRKGSYQRGVQRAEEAVESLGRIVGLLVGVTQPLQCGDAEGDWDEARFYLIHFFCLYFKERVHARISKSNIYTYIL